MDVTRSRVELRERGLLEVFDLSVRFAAVHARAYALLSAVVLAPAFVVSAGAGVALGWAWGWAVTVALTALVGPYFVVLASRLVFADEVRAREALGPATRALPRIAGARLLQGVALLASLAGLGLPWLWAGPSSLYVAEVLSLEQPGALFAAFGRARRLAGTRFDGAFAALFLLFGVQVGAALVGDVAGREALEILEIAAPPSLFQLGGSVLALLGWWATVPLLATARFFLYLDTRTRAEGWDIQTRFAALRARADGGAAPFSSRPPPAAVRVAVVLGLLLGALAGDARAALDPSRAAADLEAASAQAQDAFCREPHRPLSRAARRLCPHAEAIAGCEGFAAACREADGDGDRFSWWKNVGEAGPWLAALGIFARTLVWLLVVLAVTAMLVPVVRALARKGPRPSRRDRAVTPRAAVRPADEGDLPALDEEALLARAEDLARRGEHVAAIQTFLAAALRALGRRGALRLSRERTNGEYVRACAEADAKPALAGLVAEVERAQFGGAVPSAAEVAGAGARAAAIVRAAAVVVAMLAGAAGCGPGFGRAGLRHVADDPAGDDLFRDLLRRQGMKVEPLQVALASLPTPTADDPGPAVVVDCERTDLDDVTRAHLARWVEAGGALVLAGDVASWPKELSAKTLRGPGGPELVARRVLGRANDDDDDDDAEHEELAAGAGKLEAGERAGEAGTADFGVYAPAVERGVVASPDGLLFEARADSLAWYAGGPAYAGVATHGAGYVVGIANHELLTNVGLRRPGNAAVMVDVFSAVDRLELRVARDEDGVEPPSSPLASLQRAGLGVALVHALAASLVLFLAAGLRMTRPRPRPAESRRRAFAEHVAAVGRLYERARAAPQALAAYARFAEERLRARMPRGATDLAAFVAARANRPLDDCRRLFSRAEEAKQGAPVRGDELAVLGELSEACGAAIAREQDFRPGARSA